MANKISLAALSIGAGAVLIGIALAIGDKHLCRTSCWIDNLIGLVLPKEMQNWAGGVTWIVVGIGIIFHAILRRRS